MKPSMFQRDSSKLPEFLTLNPASVNALHQLTLVSALAGAMWFLAAAHLSVIARPLYLLITIFLAYLYMRRSPWQYLTFVLWLWTTSPFIRRVVDYYGGFQASNPILLAPQVASLLMLSSMLTSERLLKLPEAASGMLLLLPAFYGLAVSMVKGEIFAGAVASLDWILPLLVYFYLIQLAPRIDELEKNFRDFVALNLVVITLYGLFQYYTPPAWDLKWAADTHILMLNNSELKPFSTLNNAGPCAMWLGTLILLSMHFKTLLSSLTLPFAMLFLAFTEVRMTLGTVALGILMAGIFGERRIKQSVLLIVAAAALAIGVIAIFDPKASNELQNRFSTVKDLKDDMSAQARRQLYASAPALIDGAPLGMGIGALGKGASIGGSGGMVDFDSGIIAPFVALGWLGGTIYMFGSLVVVTQAWNAAFRTRMPTVTILAIAATTGLLSTIFTLGVGLQGLVIWLTSGYACTLAIQARMKQSSRGYEEFCRFFRETTKEKAASQRASYMRFN